VKKEVRQIWKMADVFDPDYANRNLKAERKTKKFFRFAVPILIVEILVLIGLSVYFIALPKNYCRISSNVDSAVFYVNNKKTDNFRFVKPTSSKDYYTYEADMFIKLPGDSDYQLEITVYCSKYPVSLVTDATKIAKVYHLTAKGGEKVKFASGISILTSKKINNFDVKIKINASKM